MSKVLGFYVLVWRWAWRESAALIAGNKAGMLLVWLLMFIAAGMIPGPPTYIRLLFASQDQMSIMMAAVYSAVATIAAFVPIFLCKILEAPARLYHAAASEQQRIKADGEVRGGFMRLITEGTNLRSEVLRINNPESTSAAIEDWYKRAQEFVLKQLGDDALARFQSPNQKVTHRPVGKVSKETLDAWAFFERALPVLEECYKDAKK